MPEVASIFTGSQIGAETTPGTAVAANRLLSSIALEPGISINFNRFRPMGQLVASQITPGQDFTEWNVTGVGNYSEIVYPLNSLLIATTPAVVDTSARRWTFTPAGRSEDTIKTYTVESGSATRAQKAAYVLFNGLEITFNRTDGVAISGSAIGQNIQDNITLTASPTLLAEQVMLPTHLDLYVDPTSGAIGTTKLLRDFNAVFRCNDRWGAVWPINSANPSYASHVNTEPTVQIELTMAADSTGMGYLTNARAGSTVYIQLQAKSTLLAGAATAFYDCLIKMAAKVSAINAFDDQDGIKVLTYVFDAIYDPAWGTGKYVEIQVTNQIATL